MTKLLYTSTIIVLLATGCGNLNAPSHPADLPLRYYNAQYNFTFFLPVSWERYSVLTQQWVPAYSATPEHGPTIVLRHPQWKASAPYHDIRILVFTRRQWEADKQGKISYGAGGVEEEVGHNDKYVFATWSRFYWDELKGWKEAGDIVNRNMAANAPHLHAD